MKVFFKFYFIFEIILITKIYSNEKWERKKNGKNEVKKKGNVNGRQFIQTSSTNSEKKRSVRKIPRMQKFPMKFHHNFFFFLSSFY